MGSLTSKTRAARTSVGLLAAVLGFAIAATAGAATRMSVSGPPTAAPGAQVSIVVELAGKAAAIRGARVQLYLSATPKAAGAQRVGARARFKLARSGKAGKATVRFTAPRAGRYYVIACLKARPPRSCVGAVLNVAAASGGPLPPATTTTIVATPVPQTTTTTVTTTPTTTTTPVPVSAPAPGPTDPPAHDPAADAPPLSAREATSLADATSFLYTGPDAVQHDVDSAAVEQQRVAVVRGVVHDGSGDGLGGVRVTVVGHPGFGYTDTQTTGEYDIAVNGGGSLTLAFSRAGYISAERQVQTTWENYATADPLTMVPYDAASTLIDASSRWQVATASAQTDSDGSRTQRLLFAPGTQATAVVDGSDIPISAPFRVRSTEFTVGAGGPDSMPAGLPPTSAYTYMTEYSIDEAVAAGASTVRFSAPVISYVENFTGMPVGTLVPTGTYDPRAGTWSGTPNGVVLKVLSENGGRAQLDLDGSGTEASDAVYAAVGISDGERAELAELYPVGTELMRTAIAHFSLHTRQAGSPSPPPGGLPWDQNFGLGPSPTAVPPPGGAGTEGTCRGRGCAPCPPTTSGSVIYCTGQALGEVHPLTGAPFALDYNSDSQPGMVGNRTIVATIAGAEVPPPGSGLLGAIVQIDVAGQHVEQTVPVTPNATYRYVWNGKDVYGRVVSGMVTASVHVGYKYRAVYSPPAGNVEAPSVAWARFGSGTRTVFSRAEGTYTLWADSTTQVSGRALQPAALGGWSLDALDSYDPGSHTLRRGNGTVRSATALAALLTRVAGAGYRSAGTPVSSGDGAAAKSAQLDAPRGLAAGPDGSIYIAEADANRVRRVAPDGTISTVAGAPGDGVAAGGHGGDGGPATAATLSAPHAVALGSDGSLYIADTGSNRIRRVAPDGTISTFAGGGSPVDGLGDDGPATAARLSAPMGVATSPDGRVWIADTLHHRVRVVSVAGEISTVAGNGTAGLSGDGAASSDAELRAPQGVAVDRSGDVLIADTGNNRVRRVDLSGQITTLASTAAPVALSPMTSGDVAVVSAALVAQIAPDGTVSTLAGGGDLPEAATSSALADNVTPTSLALEAPSGIATAPGGELYIAEASTDGVRGNTVWKLAPALPGFYGTDNLVPSSDGRSVERFAAGGRELATYDKLTGALIHSFSYDTAGRLIAVDDPDSLRATSPAAPLLTINRNSAGEATSLVARGGQVTTLTTGTDGYLSKIADPGGATTDLSYAADGMLQTLTDPLDGVHHFEYDADGRLTKDSAPGPTVTTLSSNDTDHGWTVHVDVDGRTSTYTTTLDPATGVTSVVTTDPTGAVTTTEYATDGGVAITTPDGTRDVRHVAPDPRFGPGDAYVSKDTVTTPSGLTSVATATRTANFSGPLSLTSQTDTTTLNGHTTTVQYTGGGTPKIVTTTPTGRTTTAELDARGRVVSVTPASGLSPITQTYNPDGLVASIAQAGHSLDYGYNARDLLATTTDTTGRTWTRSYRSDDRLASYTTPAGRTWDYGYDAAGDIASVTSPAPSAGGARPRYDLTYAADGLVTSVTPPVVGGAGATTLSFTSTRDLDTVGLASGAAEHHSYGAGGNLTGSTTLAPGGAATDTTAAYTQVPGVGQDGAPAGLTDQIAQMTWARGTGPATQTDTQTFDGGLPAQAGFSGAATGTYTYANDANFDIASVAVEGGSPAVSHTYAVTRDADRRMTRFGPFAFARDPATSQITRVSDAADGTASLGYAYDTHDASNTERTLTTGGGAPTTVYDLAITRDTRGRISDRTETVNGIARDYVYSYDDDGNLVKVTKTVGATTTTVEEYTYDGDGNRLTAAYDGGPAESASYTQADWLTSRGTTAYSHDAAGMLTARGVGDHFTYDARGDLLHATAAGHDITYDYDAIGRLVRRADATASQTTSFLYGDPANRNLVTATTDAAGVLTTYFYDDNRMLVGLERAGVRYLVATDQVGTPRLVAKLDGTLVRRFNHDSFGRPIADSDPGAAQSDPAFDLPLGYAGGIEDPVTGFVRFGARDYDTAAGRWTTPDPTGFRGSPFGLYRYTDGDPVTNRDSSGLWCPGRYESGNWDAFKYLIIGDTDILFGNDNDCGEPVAIFRGAVLGDLWDYQHPLPPPWRPPCDVPRRQEHQLGGVHHYFDDEPMGVRDPEAEDPFDYASSSPDPPQGPWGTYRGDDHQPPPVKHIAGIRQ